MKVFEKYPQLKTLKGLISESILAEELQPKLFEQWRAKAKDKIPVVRLCDIFPVELEKESIKLENFLGHWGNVCIESLCKISLIIKYFKPLNLFEFGTYNGMTTLQMAINSPPNAKVCTLDLPLNAKTKYNLNILDQTCNSLFDGKFNTTTGSYFQGTNYEDKIIQILHDSATFDFSPYHKNMDFIFIDAAHDYENKACDTNNALDMLTDDGIIVWDNYCDVLHPDTTKYLAELADEIPLSQLKGTPLVIHWAKFPPL